MGSVLVAIALLASAREGPPPAETSLPEGNAYDTDVPG